MLKWWNEQYELLANTGCANMGLAHYFLGTSTSKHLNVSGSRSGLGFILCTNKKRSNFTLCSPHVLKRGKAVSSVQ